MTISAVEIPGYVVGTWDIDPVRSRIGFEARHLFVSKVRGHFENFEGQIITATAPLHSSATLTVQMNSVNTGNQTRDDDLRSDNFFAAVAYPVMIFRSVAIRHDGHHFAVDGDLTVRGVTRPVSLRFEINGFAPDPADGRIRATFSASGEIKRMDFGVCSSVPDGGGLASDKVRIDIQAAAVLRNQR
jgi:polyisoprenoid-binding protein YceI